MLTDIFAPDADVATAREEFGRYQQACSTAATARALLALSYELDVSDLLAEVRAPTLVVHRAHDRAAPVEQAAALADGIAGCAARSCCPAARTCRTSGDADELCATRSAASSACAGTRGARER